MKLTVDGTCKDDLEGVISVKFKTGNSLEKFCIQHIPDYNPEKLEVLSVRFSYKEKMSILIYAIDNNHMKETDVFKLPVRKFTIDTISIKELLLFIAECNLTFTSGDYSLDEMEVIDSITIPKKKEEMKTMVSCLKMLDKIGFKTQFKACEDGLISLNTERKFLPDEIVIVNFYRFEGETDPQDSAILYAIETKDGEQGTLIDAYGAYNDPFISDVISKVEVFQKNRTQDLINKVK